MYHPNSDEKRKKIRMQLGFVEKAKCPEKWRARRSKPFSISRLICNFSYESGIKKAVAKRIFILQQLLLSITSRRQNRRFRFVRFRFDLSARKARALFGLRQNLRSQKPDEFPPSPCADVLSLRQTNFLP